MKQFEEHIQKITFSYSVMIRGDDKHLWGLFSKKSNTGRFEWFHTKENGHWLSIQTGIKGNWKKIQPMYLPFEECLKLACEYDDLCGNSEQF
jgi:hypothetical protein